MATATVKDFSELPAMLTMKQLQQVCGISRPTAYQMIRQAGFPIVRFKRALRVPKHALLRWIESGGRIDVAGSSDDAA